MDIPIIAPAVRLRAAAAASLLFFMPAWAEAGSQSLSQLIERALRNNAELAAFAAQKGIRDAGRVKAGLLPNPTLEFEAATGALTGSSAESTLALGVSQEFLPAGKRAKRLALADRELEVYRSELADRQRVLSAEVKGAFYQLVLARQRLALADGNIALNRQLLEVARERYAAGDIPELEMNLVQVELARGLGKRLELMQAVNERREKLATLAGLPPQAPLEPEGDLTVAPLAAQDLGDLKRRARERRPDLKALNAERVRGESELALALAEQVPNLTAGLSLKRDTTSIEVAGIEGRDTAYTIGVRVSLPIPVFDKNQAAVQEARARQEGAATRFSRAVTQVEREVESAHASLQLADQILALYQGKVLPQLEENLKLTQEAYRLGEVGLLAVIEEQKKFIEVNEGYLTAQHDRVAAQVKLDTVVANDSTGGDL